MLDILKRDIPISMEYENIYISRKDVSSKKWMHYRVLLNENDIINKLNEVGFREIQLMNYSVEEKIQIFKSAKKIIQTVGSNCYNLRFIEPKTWCCILYHPEYYCWSDDLHRIVNYKNGVYKEYIDSCKVVDNSNSYYPDEYNTMKKKIDSPWKFTDIDNLVKETII
jgi:capsular polysaccharide biosynthesis protein